MKGDTHIRAALRLMSLQTVGGLAAGGAIAGVLDGTTHLGWSGGLFVAAVVVASVGIGWSFGGPKRGLPATLGIARLDDPVGISQRPTGSSQADAVLAVSSVLAALLLGAVAVIAG